MFLAIDVGNTNCVLGCFESEGAHAQFHPKFHLKMHLKIQWRLSTYPLCTGDEFRIKVESLLGEYGLKLKDLSAIVCSSVVPSFSRILHAAFSKQELYLLNSEAPFSFEIIPPYVGIDRLVNAEAVSREYGAPCIILDMGTATTLCAISPYDLRPSAPKSVNRVFFLGGAIFPGIEMGLTALVTKTAQLSTVELTPPKKAIGENTEDALRSGVLLGYASMLEGMVERFRAEMAEGLNSGASQIPVIATGGAANLLKGITKVWTVFDPDLTLKGIAQLYDSFCKRKS